VVDRGFAISIESLGETVFNREMLRLSENAADWGPAFFRIHESFLGIESTQFRTEGSFSGGWRPLKPATVEHKRGHGLDLRILHATLALRNSLTRRTDPNHIYTTTADSMFVGTRVPYGEFHQKGTGHLPRRPPVALQEQHKRAWVKFLQAHVMSGVS
jgi:phage gpG-like protein